jgi:3-dehydroquinate synthase
MIKNFVTNTPIFSSGKVANDLNETLANIRFTTLFVIADEHTSKLCLPMLNLDAKEYFVIEIPSGEAYKNLETCQLIWNQLTEKKADRQALVINLGGGVIGDMGGFCAATFKRGLRFIQIPTTLLAQVDASVGGKLGIDFNGFKNHIGLYQLPVETIIDNAFLNTLPREQLVSGFAEMIKHGLIANGSHYDELSQINPDALTSNPELVQDSVTIKLNIVNRDAMEVGPRKLLNYGHTVGHAIETFYLRKNKPILHGYAIAAGMIVENYIAETVTGLNTDESTRINAFIQSQFDLPIVWQEQIPELIDLMIQDKKNLGGKIMMSLLKQKGSAVYDQPVYAEQIKKALIRFQQLNHE